MQVLATYMSGQVEIGVIGQVYEGGLGRGGRHDHLEGAIVQEVESYGYYDVSWVALVSVLGEQGHDDLVILDSGIPWHEAPAFFPTVKSVFSHEVLGQRVLFTVQGEVRVVYPIGAASHCRSDVVASILGQVVCNVECSFF